MLPLMPELQDGDLRISLNTRRYWLHGWSVSTSRYLVQQYQRKAWQLRGRWVTLKSFDNELDAEDYMEELINGYDS